MAGTADSPLSALPTELKRCIVKAIVADHDAIRLERLAASCHDFFSLSREAEFWRSLLLAHFDGRLPPALDAIPLENSRGQLLETVRFARELVVRQAKKRVLQVPAGSPQDKAAITAWEASPAYKAWQQGMMAALLDAGGPVRKYNPRTRIFVSYGRHVHVTEMNYNFEQDIGHPRYRGDLTQADATLSGWVTFAPSDAQKDDGRYGPLAGWIDGKLDGPLYSDSSVPVLDLEGDVRALVAKHRLGDSAVSRLLAAARGEAVDAADDGMAQYDEEDDDGFCMPTRNERPIATTKKLTGLYSGMFAYNFESDQFGNSHVCLTCLGDGKSTTWDDEDDDAPW